MASFIGEIDLLVGTETISGSPVKIEVYPNPASDKFTLALKGVNQGDYELRLIDCLGNVIYHKPLMDINDNHSGIFEMKNFSKGVYFISIQNQKLSEIRKIVII